MWVSRIRKSVPIIKKRLAITVNNNDFVILSIHIIMERNHQQRISILIIKVSVDFLEIPELKPESNFVFY